MAKTRKIEQEVIDEDVLTDEEIEAMTADELLKHIETTQPELLGEKPKKLTKAEQKQMEREEKERKEAERIASFELLPFDGGSNPRIVLLADLIPLDVTPIPNARLAMRELNQQHLEHMRIGYEQNPANFPPIDVQQSTWGYIVVDGYHRWQIIVDELEKHLKKMGDHEYEANAEGLRGTVKVSVNLLNITNPRDLVKAAFQANLNHGLPATDASRGRYGLWLMEVAKEEGHPISMRQAALMAGCSHVALSRLAKRIREKDAKMIDSFMSPEDIELVEDESINGVGDKSNDKLEIAIKAIVKNMKLAYTEVGLEMTPSTLAEYIKSFDGKVSSETYKLFGLALIELAGFNFFSEKGNTIKESTK